MTNDTPPTRHVLDSKTALAAATGLAMVAFAANSLLCRQAFRETSIDAASFTTLRIASGALVLWLLTGGPKSSPRRHGNWLSALALFAYAVGFSFAYRQLPAATGALLLFGAVQATMIGHGLAKGERFSLVQTLGFLLALGGLVGLLLPGLTAPPLVSSMEMAAAGIAWGVYSLRGKGVRNPVDVTGGNFLRAAPLALLASLAFRSTRSIDLHGALLALASGALASGLGYSIWYAVVPRLRATQASIVQLSVPVIATLGAIGFLGEVLTLRLVLASMAILGGIALVILRRAPISRTP